MNRRVALCIAVIGLNLMACCCGGAGRRPAPPAEQAKAADPEKPVDPPAKDVVKPGDSPDDVKKPVEKYPEPKPAKVYSADDISDSFVKSIRIPKGSTASQTLSSTIGPIKVELQEGHISALAFRRYTVSGLLDLKTEGDHLVVKVRVSNRDSLRAVKYDPWHGVPESTPQSKRPVMRDESGAAHPFWVAGPSAWPTGGIEKSRSIPPEKTMNDVIGFKAPDWFAEEFEFALPASNVGQSGQFKFKFVRAFFEHPAARKKDVADHIERTKAWEAARLTKEDASRFAAEKKDREARIDADRRAKVAAELAAIAAKQRAEEEARELRLGRVRRENYDKLRNRISLREAQEILGPATENSSSGSLQLVSWRSKGFPIVVITATFDGGFLVSKAIID